MSQTPGDIESTTQHPDDSLGPDLARRQIGEYMLAAGDYARLLVEASLDMIIAVDLTLRIVEFNPAAEACFGYTRDEVIGRSVEMLYRDPESAWKVRTASFRDGFVGQIWNRRKNGEAFLSRLSSRLVRDASGEVIGVMGVSRDITAEVRTAEALEARTRELEAARARADANAAARSTFLAHVSHEIRTPMTSILGYAECLRRPQISESERTAAIETICRNGEHLLAVINDILDLSKIEAGKLTIERIRCCPIRLVTDALDLMYHRVASKGLALSLHWRGPIPESIETDPTRVRQILINLLGNALKFTATGKVRVSVRMDERGAAPLLQIAVLDTGIGIAPESAGRLFDPFAQADPTTPRRFGGTGLGLSICRRLAQSLGGDVRIARSRPDRGSCFLATIATGSLAGVSRRHPTPPTASGEGSAGPKPIEAALSGLNILLADDCPDNRRLITHILRRAGAVVTIVADGRAAVDAALGAQFRRRHTDAGLPFDVILMDMQMPILDGYCAVQVLRTRGYAGPIIALTAFADAEDRAKCLASGCNDFANKPIGAAALVEIVRRQVLPPGDGRFEASNDVRGPRDSAMSSAREHQRTS